MSDKGERQVDVGYAWVIAVASFLMQACASGTFSGYGVFMEYYTNLVFPNENKSKVAMIGNLAPTVIGLASVVTGRVCQLFGVRVCIVAGAVLMSGGHVLASFGTEVWHFAATQGIMVGLGGALLFVPANVIVTEWFEKRRGLAAGIGSAGAGIGGMGFAQLNSRLLPLLGHKWTLQLNGGLILLVLLASLFMVRRRERNNNEEGGDAGFHSSLVLNGRFGWLAATSFLAGLAYLIPLYFINSHIISLNMTRIEGGYASSAINLGSAVGRISLGVLGDHIGYIRCYILAFVLSALTAVVWRFSTNLAVFLIFGIAYGIPSGGYAGGFGPTCAAVFGKRQLATIMGMVFFFTGLGELIGPIICGLLLDVFNNYNLLIYFTIGGYTLASLTMCLANHYTQKNNLPHLPKV
ncbi:hypothetical protein DSO57_1027676 [Entomophthora muscae]|uniref:Uncharacterized protein n=1 Tax=Entomophthora muscae TaxID=34485 RepID=A0ACC2RGD0_9FUNG|nr:hypothetical protein DSO57_1027676 [Entomophthora muscae]